MKRWIFSAVFAFAAPVMAKQVEVTCYGKYFQCRNTCQWQIAKPPLKQIINLVKDPAYPNPKSPYERWRGRFDATYDNHDLTLEIVWSSQYDRRPERVYALLNAGSVMAESSGVNEVDVALRNSTYGRGFVCTAFTPLADRGE